MKKNVFTLSKSIPAAVLIFLFLSFVGSIKLQAQITISPWKMNLDGGPQQVSPPLPFHGAPQGYAYATIPAVNDPNWVNAPLDGSGNVAFSVPSALGGAFGCLTSIDFTFFQTLVNIPALTAINTFTVSFTQVDDGARAYIFNSAHPTGAFIPGGDIIIGGPPVTANLASLAVAGEVNRIVIAQYDDCAVQNNVIGVQIIVNGTPIPVAASIICPANITVDNTAGQCGAIVSYAPAVADGNPTPTITYSHASGSFFPVGTTVVTATATNATSTATCSFNVTVTDAEDPVIVCAAPVTVNNTPGLCTGTATLTPPTVTDNCSAFTAPVEMVTNGGFTGGSASWNACGNLVETNPETVYGGSNPGNRTAEIDHEPVTLCQNIGGFIVGKSYKLSFLASRRSGAPPTVGAIVTIDGGALNTTVTRSNTTFGFTMESFTFTATQATHQLRFVPSAGWGGTVGFIVDDVSVKAANGTVTNDAPATYPVGNTTVTWTATDATGNTATCTQVVTVNDNELPVANCQPKTVTLVSGIATISSADINNGSTDNCGIKSLSVSPSTFSCANIGDNTVTLTVTDVHDNVQTCTATVTVVGETFGCSIASVPSDNTYTGGNPNTIYLGYGPQTTTLQVSAPASGAPYTYAWSPATGLSSTTGGAPVFTPTAEGNYTFTVTVTNQYGCTSTCSITICVLDIRVPGSNGKVYVCHLPQGNTANQQTIAISVNAVPAHIFNPGHGDHLGTCEQSCAALNTAARPRVVPISEDENGSFKVSASPNPSAGYFNLVIQSGDNAPVEVRIIDMYGRLVFRQVNVAPNITLRIGEKFFTGSYLVEAIQGNNRHSVKLIKANQ